MIIPATISAVGLSAGFLLICRVPVCPAAQAVPGTALSIIIPARNEQMNLVHLLQSIRTAGSQPREVLVVDDGSTDNTAHVARTLGATVIQPDPLPAGWTGKAWAYHQGALAAAGSLLLFLDADTCLQPGGLDRFVALWERGRNAQLVLSLLPFHEMSAAYEQLSLVFNILMAAGAGGFGMRGVPRLFGQSMLIERRTYFAAGGHAAVRNSVLENLRFARRLVESGARVRCLSGRGTLHMRMFPEGLSQMSESWAKAFVRGAADSGVAVVGYSIVWISALWTAVSLVGTNSVGRAGALAAYLLLAIQLAWISKQFGSYRLLTCLLYPVPLGYYCAVFGQSALRRVLKHRSMWRGREV